MTLQAEIRRHLDQTGLSMQALSLQAGLYPKAVSTILNTPGMRPRRRTLDALSGAMGIRLEAPDVVPQTYAELIALLEAGTIGEFSESRAALLASRLRWLMRAAGWVAETRTVNRHDIIDFFAYARPATFGLSDGSFATYKSDILAGVDVGHRNARRRGIADVTGLYRELYDAVQAGKFPTDEQLHCGTFFTFLDDCGLLPSEVSTDILGEYYEARLSDGVKTEAVCNKHVKCVTRLICRLAEDPAFARFRFRRVAHPFGDRRNRYGVDDAELSELMREFDTRVAPWAQGKMSRDGLSEAEFVAELDEDSARWEGKKALLQPAAKKQPKTSDEDRRSAGFLLPKETWNEGTLVNRRGMVVAAAKALFAATGYRIESVEEFTDPDVVEVMLDAVAKGQGRTGYSSTYPKTITRMIVKLARDFVGRDGDDMRRIREIGGNYKTAYRGIAPRNKSKLKQVTQERSQRFIDLGDILLDEVNADIGRNRTAYRKKMHRRAKGVEVMTAENIRDIMCALAHEILLARAPRAANLTGIRLDWISWIEDRARITIPATEVKARSQDDPDLVIPLKPEVAKKLRDYVEKIRPRALREGDEKNPYLFPAQGGKATGAAFVGLLSRLMRHAHRITGVKLNPHLYRHMVGWLWLKEDPDRLPDVSRILGHKSLQTTLDAYAEIDESLALDRWQKFIEDQKKDHKNG